MMRSKKCLIKKMKRVNTFVDMNTELVKGSKTKAEGSSKREGDELESDMSKKQKIDAHIELLRLSRGPMEAQKGIHPIGENKDASSINSRRPCETLWKLVKAKHENTRPEDDYERVLWGDLKVMFEPDIKSDV
ncbi:hypothetical protein Tco_1011058 [Tanacetum coccineum]